MKLDLRQPVFVFLGAWNPAIFQPGWVAEHLFGYPKGSSVEGGLLMTPDQPPLTFINDVGLAVSSERVSIFMQRFDNGTMAQAEAVSRSIFKVLPHTPFGAFGANFIFREDNPDDSVLDLLRSCDKIDEHFKVANQEFKTAIQFDPNVILNFKRISSADYVVFDLNFHHPKITAQNSEKLLDNILNRYHSGNCSPSWTAVYGLGRLRVAEIRR